MMKSFRVFLRVLIIAISFGLSFGQFQAHAVVSRLALDPSRPGELTEVNLPFPYKSTEGKPVKFVHQGGAHLLTQDSVEDFMVIGPVQPCIAIVVSNPENGRHLGFHKHWPNSFESLQKMITDHLETSDFTKLRVQFYSFKMSAAAYSEFYKICGRTQQQEMEDVRDFLKGLGVLDEKITMTLWEGRYSDWALGQYETAELSILVDKEGNVFSTCFLAEDLMGLRGKRVLLSKIIPGLPKEIDVYSGRVSAAGRGEFFDLEQGKVLYDELSLSRQFSSSKIRMAEFEKIHYVVYAGGNYIANITDLNSDSFYRKKEFYFVPNKVKARAEGESAAAVGGGADPSSGIGGGAAAGAGVRAGAGGGGE